MQRQRQPQTHSPRRETINMLRGVAAGTGAVADTAQVACCRLQQHHVYSHRFGRASRAEIAQLVARRSHNPKVVSSILTSRISCYMDTNNALPSYVRGFGGDYVNERREIRTPNLLIWSQTRCRCAIHPMFVTPITNNEPMGEVDGSLFLFERGHTFVLQRHRAS